MCALATVNESDPDPSADITYIGKMRVSNREVLWGGQVGCGLKRFSFQQYRALLLARVAALASATAAAMSSSAACSFRARLP